MLNRICKDSSRHGLREHQAQIVAPSALLTTTMMKDTIEIFVEAGVRDQVKVIISGAPVTKSYTDDIGADGYADDAGGASKAAKALLSG